MNLYIYSYNNYYNRQVKKAGDNISDYQEYLHYGPVTGVYGFTPGDGVNTQQIIGTNTMLYDGKGDYLIAHNPQTNEIDSRWFIIDVNRSRSGQWELTLHRDLLVDYYDKIVDAPIFIEKATLSLNSPLIFNPENMSVNQIKTNETLLKDQSGCAWLVGYYAQDSQGIQGTVNSNQIGNVPFVELGYSFDDWPLRNYTNKPLEGQTQQFFYGAPTKGNYVIRTTEPVIVGEYPANQNITYFTYIYNANNTTYSGGNFYYGSADYNLKSTPNMGYTPSTIANKLKEEYAKVGMNSLNASLSSYVDIHTKEEEEEFQALNGKLLKTLDGRYFTCSVQTENDISTGKVDLSGTLQVSLKNIAYNSGLTGEITNNTFQVDLVRNRYRIWLVERFDLEATYNIPDSNKLITEDAPWNIFAIPYSNDLTIKGNELDFTCNQQIAINAAMSIQKQHGSKVFDIQLLPYCPIPDLITDTNEITVENDKQYSLISQGDTNLSIIFNVPNAKFNTTLTSYIFPQASSNIERKLNNQCDKWRLTSPNYSNYFDFSVEKNNGIQSFDVDCEYKPFTPYIHINPSFSGLYGYDDNSPRGLVCGGDFSLSRISDQWIEYEIQNKNFQATFDRQIQNMETQQDIQRKQERWQVATGTLQGAVSGAATGSIMSGGDPITGAITGVIGGAASLAGGLADIKYNELLRNEALDYTKDQFGYSLDNIRALPNTISKISAFNNNNKIFPVLEYYTCTEEEKKAFLRKMAWNGMSVGIIDTIKPYLTNNWSMMGIESQGYIKGKLIRLTFGNNHEEDVHSEDFHVINAISGELDKGAYF